jgi:hypothetical protein
MSKVKKMNTDKPVTGKISDQELTEINKTQAEMQGYLTSIGAVEVEKAKAIYQVNMLENKLNDLKVNIEKAYGPININLADGSYEYIVVKD